MSRKILYAANSFNELLHYHLPYLAELYEKGIELHVAASGERPNCAYFAKTFSIPETSSINIYDIFSIVRFLIPIIKNENYNLIVLDGTRISKIIRTALLFIVPPVPYVVNMIDIYPISNKTGFIKKQLFIAGERFLRCVTDDIIAFNDEDSYLAKKFHFCKKNIYSFPGIGVNLADYSKATEDEKHDARYALGIPQKAFVILYNNEYFPYANHEMLIEAMRFMPDDVYLYIPGSGPTLEYCREKADSLGVLPNVIFSESTPSHTLCCHAADIAVSPALYESISYSTIEALACGLPVVVSDIKGNRQLVSNNENGYTFPPDNAYKFSQIVIDIYSDRELEYRLGQSSRDFLKKYDINNIISKIINILLY